MTKVSILGQINPVEEEKKKIKFLGCLMDDCSNTNYDDFSKGTLDPSTYDEIILISRKYGNKDVMLAKQDGIDFIMFGYFNDGIV